MLSTYLPTVPLSSPRQPSAYAVMKLFTVVTVLLMATGPADASGFARTCKSWKVQGDGNSVLRACCLDARGYYKISEIHLKHCLANLVGLVKKREGNFHRSCHSCRVQSKPDSVFTCRCFIETENADWYETSFNNLVSVCNVDDVIFASFADGMIQNNIIFNRDGKVGCFDFVGGDKGTDSNCRGYGAQLLLADESSYNVTEEEEFYVNDDGD